MSEQRNAHTAHTTFQCVLLYSLTVPRSLSFSRPRPPSHLDRFARSFRAFISNALKTGLKNALYFQTR